MIGIVLTGTKLAKCLLARGFRKFITYMGITGLLILMIIIMLNMLTCCTILRFRSLLVIRCDFLKQLLRIRNILRGLSRSLWTQ